MISIDNVIWMPKRTEIYFFDNKSSSVPIQPINRNELLVGLKMFIWKFLDLIAA